MKPRVDEFIVFYECLTADAPNGYKPWFFRCVKGGKNPIPGISWKNPRARLTMHESIKWMNDRGNIGIAGTDSDPLTIIDQDHGTVWELSTLRARSRSRVGLHSYVFSANPKLPNIPTDHAGEVRSRWQYVIAPGGFVFADPNTVPPEDRGNAGYYTIEEARSLAWVKYADLPEIFRQTYEANKAVKAKKPSRFNPKKATGSYSAVFDVTARDVVIREGGNTKPTARWGSLFHDSTTEANMSLSASGLLHCWRHNVSHNGLQALAVLSGYLTCREAGTPHKGAGGGGSRVVGDDGAIFHAWLYAKINGYIPQDDPIPVRGLHHIARQRLGYNPQKGELLPPNIYNKVIEIVEGEF